MDKITKVASPPARASQRATVLFEPYATGRNIRRSPFWEREKALGGYFMELGGWERAHGYAANEHLRRLQCMHSALHAAAASRAGCTTHAPHDWATKQPAPKRKPNCRKVRRHGKRYFLCRKRVKSMRCRKYGKRYLCRRKRTARAAQDGGAFLTNPIACAGTWRVQLSLVYPSATEVRDADAPCTAAR
jgi:hypothetical protein